MHFHTDLSHSKHVSWKNDAKTPFSILHHLSPVIFANTTAVAFALLHNSSFTFHCYIQREPTPTQKSAWKCQLQPFVTSCAKGITKGIHSCKPASLNRPAESWAASHTSLSQTVKFLGSKGLTYACWQYISWSCSKSIFGMVQFDWKPFIYYCKKRKVGR